MIQEYSFLFRKHYEQQCLSQSERMIRTVPPKNLPICVPEYYDSLAQKDPTSSETRVVHYILSKTIIVISLSAISNFKGSQRIAWQQYVLCQLY